MKKVTENTNDDTYREGEDPNPPQEESIEPQGQDEGNTNKEKDEASDKDEKQNDEEVEKKEAIKSTGFKDQKGKDIIPVTAFLLFMHPDGKVDIATDLSMITIGRKADLIDVRNMCAAAKDEANNQLVSRLAAQTVMGSMAQAAKQQQIKNMQSQLMNKHPGPGHIPKGGKRR